MQVFEEGGGFVVGVSLLQLNQFYHSLPCLGCFQCQSFQFLDALFSCSILFLLVSLQGFVVYTGEKCCRNYLVIGVDSDRAPEQPTKHPESRGTIAELIPDWRK
jgi:hypothetical protein